MIDFLVSSSKTYIGNDMTMTELFYMGGMYLFMFIVACIIDKVDNKRKAIIMTLLFIIQLVVGILLFGIKYAFFDILPLALIFIIIFIVYLITNKKKCK